MHFRGNQGTHPVRPQGGRGARSNVRFDFCFIINQTFNKTWRRGAGPGVDRLESI
jgi:hypothetical protein